MGAGGGYAGVSEQVDPSVEAYVMGSPRTRMEPLIQGLHDYNRASFGTLAF